MNNNKLLKNVFLIVQRNYIYLTTFLMISALVAYYIIIHLTSILSNDTAILYIANKNRVLSERIALITTGYVLTSSEDVKKCMEDNLRVDLELLASSNNALLCTKKNSVVSDLDKKIKMLYAKESASDIDRYINSGKNILDPTNINKAKDLEQIYLNLNNGIEQLIKIRESKCKITEIQIRNTERMLSLIIWLIIAITVMKYLSNIEMKNSTRKILIVEDNRVASEIVQQIITNAGFYPVAVTNGQEALDALSVDRNFVLIFMDCEMPIMGGIEATRAIRIIEKQKGLPNIPIIALTASVSEGDKEKCLDCGMYDYLQKPVDIIEMKKMIKKWSK